MSTPLTFHPIINSIYNIHFFCYFCVVSKSCITRFMVCCLTVTLFTLFTSMILSLPYMLKHERSIETLFIVASFLKTATSDLYHWNVLSRSKLSLSLSRFSPIFFRTLRKWCRLTSCFILITLVS